MVFRQPGAYVILDPIRKMTNIPNVINIPGEKADLTATSVLLDLLNCDFKSWTNHTKNWRQKFWWESNIKEMPSCPKDQSLCGNVTSQGAQRPFHLPKKYTDSKIWIFWCKTTWGTTFTKGILPLVGESR